MREITQKNKNTNISNILEKIKKRKLTIQEQANFQLILNLIKKIDKHEIELNEKNVKLAKQIIEKKPLSIKIGNERKIHKLVEEISKIRMVGETPKDIEKKIEKILEKTGGNSDLLKKALVVNALVFLNNFIGVQNGEKIGNKERWMKAGVRHIQLLYELNLKRTAKIIGYFLTKANTPNFEIHSAWFNEFESMELKRKQIEEEIKQRNKNILKLSSRIKDPYSIFLHVKEEYNPKKEIDGSIFLKNTDDLIGFNIQVKSKKQILKVSREILKMIDNKYELKTIKDYFHKNHNFSDEKIRSIWRSIVKNSNIGQNPSTIKIQRRNTGYSAIHILFKDEYPIEIQVTTKEDYLKKEHGRASHFSYKLKDEAIGTLANELKHVVLASKERGKFKEIEIEVELDKKNIYKGKMNIYVGYITKADLLDYFRFHFSDANNKSGKKNLFIIENNDLLQELNNLLSLTGADKAIFKVKKQNIKARNKVLYIIEDLRVEKKNSNA